MRLGIAFKFSAVAALLTLLGAGAAGLLVSEGAGRMLLEHSRHHLVHLADLESAQLNNILDGARRDIQILARTRQVRRLINGPLGSSSIALKDEIADLFSSVVSQHPWYTQLRLVGVADDGRELVRVDQVDGRLGRTPEHALQQKGGRDYFQAAITLPEGGFYLSPINLNREFGHIELPHLPVMRAAVTLFDARGERFGILIVNLDMRVVFASLEQLLPADARLYLANSYGDWLVHPDPTRTFGFDMGNRHTIQDEFPGVEPLLAGHVNEAWFERAASPPHEIRFSSLVLESDPGRRNLILGISLTSSRIMADERTLWWQSALYTLLLSVLAMALAWAAARRLMRPLEQVINAIAGFHPGAADLPLPVRREDELGELARRFQSMADQIHQQLGALSEQSQYQRYRSLFETAADAILLIEEDGTVLDFNQSACRIFGYESSEVIGRNVSMLVPWPYREHHDGYLRHYRETDPSVISPVGREVEGLRKNGNRVRLRLSIAEFQHEGRRAFTGILHDITATKELEDQLRQQASTDPLTELLNRRHFLMQSEREFLRAQRHSHPLAVLIMDIDYFKRVNDTYGHLAGDAVLRHVAEMLRMQLRDYDIAGRFGGDEFVVTLPENTGSAAFRVADRLREQIMNTPYPWETQRIPLTISVGVAEAVEADTAFDSVLTRADQALYGAKAAGRATVHLNT